MFIAAICCLQRCTQDFELHFRRHLQLGEKLILMILPTSMSRNEKWLTVPEQKICAGAGALGVLFEIVCKDSVVEEEVKEWRVLSGWCGWLVRRL